MRSCVTDGVAVAGMLKPFQYKLNDVEETRASGMLLHPYPVNIFDPAPASDAEVNVDDVSRRKTVGVLLQTREERRILEARQNLESNPRATPPAEKKE